MSYDKTKTISFKLSEDFPESIEILDELCIDEGYIGREDLFGVDVEVINIDTVEMKVANLEKRNANSSMDLAFLGVENGQDYILFVELRFNYKNLKNLSLKKLKDKVEGSTSLVDGLIPVKKKFPFIFQSDQVQFARHRIQRMNPTFPNEYTVMDLEGLKRSFF
jgi:hypothetical protein